jgi:osmotically-inducible protein OsmY
MTEGYGRNERNQRNERRDNANEGSREGSRRFESRDRQQQQDPSGEYGLRSDRDRGNWDDNDRTREGGWDQSRDRNYGRQGSHYGQQGGNYGQGSHYAQGSHYGQQGGSYGQGSSYGLGSHYAQGGNYGQTSGWSPSSERSALNQLYDRERDLDRNAWSNAQREFNRDSTRQSFVGKGPKNYTRSDERIREDVCDRLSDDDEVDATDITITVRDGEVTLEGSVNDRRAKHRAEDIADNVRGVKDVHNRLSARKGMLQEIGDRITGKDETPHGHAGAGPRNSTGSVSSSSSSIRNGS